MTQILFPVTHSLVCGEAVLTHVRQRYAIDSPIWCRLLKTSLNDTYLLAASHNRYVVRLYGARRPAGEIAYELDLLTHLAAKGAPVSIPVADKDGRLAVPLLAAEGTRHLVVFTYVPGKPMRWADEGHSYLSGRLLATIHTASDDFFSSHVRPALDVEFLIDGPLRVIQPFLTHRKEDWLRLEEVTGKLRERVEAAGDAGLDWGVCHGDFSAKNIHIAGDQEATVLDFDFSGPGWRTYDFAPIRRAAMEPKTHAAWDAFLTGYTEIRRFSDADLDAVPLFRVLRHLSMWGVLAQNVEEWGTRALDDRSIDRWMRVFRDWDERPSADCEDPKASGA